MSTPNDRSRRMITSLHIADVSPGSAVALLRRALQPDEVPGLRHAEVALAAPLSPRLLPRPQLTRIAQIAFWEDDDAHKRFEAQEAADSENGWHADLEAMGVSGRWPGLDSDLPRPQDTRFEGLAAVLTLGRLRLRRSASFLRASAKTQAAALEANGLLWGTGLARPPFVATFSLWSSTGALSTYAYGRRKPAHAETVRADRTDPFHHQSAFIRFRVRSWRGSLGERNPLDPDTLNPTGGGPSDPQDRTV